jgi:diguanylate cyclase (GGDEF)-like protein
MTVLQLAVPGGERRVMRAITAPRRMRGLFLTYAMISLVPILILGVVLVASVRRGADQRGLDQGRSEARLVARTAVEPLLGGRPLGLGISGVETAALHRLARHAVGDGDVLRFRLRDLAGHVVFSDDGSGFGAAPDDEAIDAAHGDPVAELTQLNSDTTDVGRRGVESVEVYLPLRAGSPARDVGVLELYLPYAPISRDVSAGLHQLYRDLAIGLALVYLALFLITTSVTRGLRRGARTNAFLAEHDPLTALPNRLLFHRRAERALADAARRGQALAIAIVDLDHFKEINDTLGHHVGDKLLTEIATMITAEMRPHDTVARLGGDEFGVILRDVADAQPILARLRSVIEREVEIRGLPLSVEASVGFAVSPEDGTDSDTLLQRADIAMYVAKAQHVGVVRYDGALDHYDAAKLSLVAELRHAIADDQLVLHYQPQTIVRTGRVEAFEALVRWEHPTHGLLYPDSFLPLAEQTDVIDRLTQWVLETALRELCTLDASSDGELKVAVNVSARSVCRSDFANRVIGTLARLAIPAERLIIEVTETALLIDPARAANVLAQLTAAGVNVSLDDFGRGQTSLGYLSALPIDELKIDKGFVMDMLQNPAHAAIVRSIVDLGHNLQLRVVAEGVESEEILDALRESGCDVAQGFLLARPMTAEKAAQWLNQAASGAQPVPEAVCPNEQAVPGTELSGARQAMRTRG